MNDETPTRRIEELDVDTCLQLLETHRVGRVGYVEENGEPVILPVNYLLDRGVVVIRTAEGSKVAAAVRKARIAFEVDDFDADLHTGWSVLVKGVADELWERDDMELAQRLPLEPLAPGDKEHFLVVLSTSITGRRITTLDGEPEADPARSTWM